MLFLAFPSYEWMAHQQCPVVTVTFRSFKPFKSCEGRPIANGRPGGGGPLDATGARGDATTGGVEVTWG